LDKKLYFSLIVCTYHRPHSLVRLLDSVLEQSLYPNEILIIDGSLNKETEILFNGTKYRGLSYHKVGKNNRGLTRQRNYGINKLAVESEIVCFLDDDIILNKFYFENLIKTYRVFPSAVGVGGLISNEVNWKNQKEGHQIKYDEFYKDGFVRKLGQRNLVRKKLGLLSDKPPGFMPDFSHGLSISFLPPNGKVYPVEFFMGGVSSYKKELFRKINFSKYFEGYGLYEDMDFCLRAFKVGDLYVNTDAQVDHFHEEAGRPDYIKYGKMVVKNGYYVWKIKNPGPDFISVLKWNAITFLLILIRLSNSFTSADKEAALKDTYGRVKGWFSLIFMNPENH